MITTYNQVNTRVHRIGHICSVVFSLQSVDYIFNFSPRTSQDIPGLSSCKVPGKCCSKNPVRWLARSSKSHHWANVSEETEPAKPSSRRHLLHTDPTVLQYTLPLNNVKHLSEKGETHKLVIGVVADYDFLGSNIHQPTDIMMLMPKAVQSGHRIEQHLCLRDLDCRTPQRQHALSEKLPAQPALHIPSVFGVMRWQPVIHYELYRKYGSLSLRVFVCLQVFGSFCPLLQRYQESFFTAFTDQRCPSWRDVVLEVEMLWICCDTPMDSLWHLKVATYSDILADPARRSCAWLLSRAERTEASNQLHTALPNVA